MRSLIVILFVLASCSYNHTKTTSYTFYYDEQKGLKKVEGTFVDGQENGEWIYYSEKGEIVQQGVYQFGKPIGDWQYNYPDLDTIINWKDFSIDNLSFNLPSCFNQVFLESDTVDKYFSDTASQSLLAIRIIDSTDSIYVRDFFKTNLASFSKGYIVKYSKSEKISIQNQKYYLDEFSLGEVIDPSKKVSQILLYMSIEKSNKLFVLGITSRNANRNVSRFVLQEIFYHFKLDNKRIVNIYDGFDVRG